MDSPPPQQQQSSPDASIVTKSRFLVVHGVRYVRPYLHDQLYSVRMHHADERLTLAQVLAHAFGRESNDWDDSVEHFRNEITQGRVQWRRNRRLHPDDPEPHRFVTVSDPVRTTRRNDVLRLRRHVHERCLVGADLVQVPCYGDSGREDDDSYMAVFKPAGVPVVGNDGTCHGSVTGIMSEKGDYRLGHRIDLPVCGILLLGKGPSGGRRIVQALSPSQKQRQEGFVKAYLARVMGGKHVFDKDKRMEIKCKLQWDNRQKRAVVVSDEDEDGRSEEAKKHKTKKTSKDTVTFVQGLEYDASTDTSLVRVELVTGARQQVRAVLASLGTPILGDTTYNGGAFPSQQQEFILFRDDEQQSLLKMLEDEKKDWCDKCRWQMEEVKKGGTKRGTEQLGHQICLLSYHYRVPSLGIDAKVPDELMPEWTRMQSETHTFHNV
jgi:23S rRNA pseudouridine1911/1915/1917 synthase